MQIRNQLRCPATAGQQIDETPSPTPSWRVGPDLCSNSTSTLARTLARRTGRLATLALALGLAACTGGARGDRIVASTCGDPAAFCLSTCNLGCARDGCNVTEIAQNQPLVFEFSQDVNPNSVDFTSFSLKTLTGEEPVGTFFTEGARVTFIPEVRSIQGITFYGFKANEQYVLTLPGGAAAPAALFSTSGDRLAQSITCNLRVSGGVVDLDGQPPKAKVITPSVERDVPLNTNIVVEFSELIDFAPFFNANLGEEPVQYRVRRTRTTNGQVVCDERSQDFPLSGTPRLVNDAVRGVTTVTFQPREQLPGNACLEVEVTSRVRDLANTRARAEVFRFILETVPVVERVVSEEFTSDIFLDQARSGGSWSGGSGVFAKLGGDGRHGDFDITDGQEISDSEYVWNTDRVVISGDENPGFLGSDTVTDGCFYFTNFVVPANTTLRLVGSKPARFFVRGKVEIKGQIIASGAALEPMWNGRDFSNPQRPGQRGTAGGPGGGAGGHGAYACDGSGNVDRPTLNNFNGYDGENLRVPNGHAYQAEVAGSGGKGSLLFPAHGNASSLVYRWLSGTYTGFTAAGGGGGGFLLPGAEGFVTEGASTGADPNRNTNRGLGELGPNTAGGRSIPLLTRPAGRRSIDHYLVGGSGGGGGASHPPFATPSTPATQRFWSGAAGTGGGGAVLIRAGRAVESGVNSLVAVRGGDGASTADAFQIGTRGSPCPGGSGSGGTLLVQCDGEVLLQGLLDARGGAASTMNVNGFFRARSDGGAGSNGYLRLEVPVANPPVSLIGNTQPPRSADNVARLDPNEKDGSVGFQSLWRVTEEVFPPLWSRYEIEAIVDGRRVVFSDDPDVGPPALAGSAAIAFYIEGANVDPITLQPVPRAPRFPWRKYVGPFGQAGERSLNDDGQTGFRWIIILDTRYDVVVKRVSIVYQA